MRHLPPHLVLSEGFEYRVQGLLAFFALLPRVGEFCGLRRDKLQVINLPGVSRQQLWGLRHAPMEIRP